MPFTSRPSLGRRPSATASTRPRPTRVAFSRAERLEGRVLLSVAPDPTYDPPDHDGEIFDHSATHGHVQHQRMAVQADGKVVVSSWHYEPIDDGHLGHSGFKPADFRVRRLVFGSHDDWRIPLDADFGDGGSVLVDFFGGDDLAQEVVVQRDGKIVVAGRAQTADGKGWVMAAARLNPDGSLDGDFGDGGKVTVAFGSVSGANAVRIDEAGRIVLAGIGAAQDDGDDEDRDGGGEGAAGGLDDAAGDGQDVAVARLLPDGTLDDSFGGDGRVTVSLGGTDAATGMAIREDGRIVLVGTTTDAGVHAGFAVMRLKADGSLDSDFDGDGTARLQFPGRALHVILDADDRVLVVGERLFTRAADGQSYTGVAAARYKADGALDPDYGDGGAVFLSRESHALEVASIALDDDGGLIVVGRHDTGAEVNSDYGVLRLDARGALDTRVGDDGLLVTDLGNSYDLPEDAAWVGDGRLLAIGASGASTRFNSMRYVVGGEPVPPEPEPPQPGPPQPPDPKPEEPEKDRGKKTRRGRSQAGAPAAAFSGRAQARRGGAYTFRVTYRSAAGIDAASVAGGGDVVVTGPNGYNATADVLRIKRLGRGTRVAVTYRVGAPGGSFDAADNGSYSVKLLSGGVLDGAGVAIPSGVLGAFTVAARNPSAVQAMDPVRRRDDW